MTPRNGQSRSKVDAGMSTCPVCGRSWLVTPRDDCLLPTCGCFGDNTTESNPVRPCERCGLEHALTCAKMPASRL